MAASAAYAPQIIGGVIVGSYLAALAVFGWVGRLLHAIDNKLTAALTVQEQHSEQLRDLEHAKDHQAHEQTVLWTKQAGQEDEIRQQRSAVSDLSRGQAELGTLVTRHDTLLTRPAT